MMHIGVDTTLYKIDAMYFSPPRVDYSNADTSRFDIRNADGSTVGFVEFTKEVKYLGSIIDSSLTSDADVDMRIKAATSAFGALKNVLTSLFVDLRVSMHYAATKPGSSINVPKQCHAMTPEPRHYCVGGIALSLISSL